jgi:hypothetical protein
MIDFLGFVLALGDLRLATDVPNSASKKEPSPRGGKHPIRPAQK